MTVILVEGESDRVALEVLGGSWVFDSRPSRS